MRLQQQLKQTETLPLVFHEYFRLHPYAGVAQLLNVSVGKQLAVAFDNGHCAVVGAQKGKKLYVVFARLCHVGKHHAVVGDGQHGNFDGGKRRGEYAQKFFQRHLSVGKHLRLRQHSVQLFRCLRGDLAFVKQPQRLLLTSKLLGFFPQRGQLRQTAHAVGKAAYRPLFGRLEAFVKAVEFFTEAFRAGAICVSLEALKLS